MVSERVTLKDVAERVGVHPSTVSRVLNPATRAMVSPEVVEKVTKTARELGYRPNPLARSLKTRSSGIVGIFVPDLANPMFPEIVRGAESILVEAGYTPVLANTRNDRDRKLMLVDHLRQRQIDGIIIITALRNDPVMETCRENGIPVVVSDRGIGESDLPGLVIDDDHGMRAMVSHLRALGHRELALISGPRHLSTSASRHRAAVGALSEQGIELLPDRNACCADFSIEAGRKACRFLIENAGNITGTLTTNDQYAIGAIAELYAMGRSCPKDMSITGYNGIRHTQWLRPPITTIELPKREMGMKMAKIMLDRLTDPKKEIERAIIQPTLVVRHSTARVF